MFEDYCCDASRIKIKMYINNTCESSARPNRNKFVVLFVSQDNYNKSEVSYCLEIRVTAFPFVRFGNDQLCRFSLMNSCNKKSAQLALTVQ